MIIKNSTPVLNLIITLDLPLQSFNLVFWDEDNSGKRLHITEKFWHKISMVNNMVSTI